MYKFLRLLTVATFIIILTACGSKDIETNMSSKVNAFEAITQDEEAFTEAELEGQWSVVNFIFTNCTTVCLPMSRNMSFLQDNIVDEGIENVQLISFSVDPEVDTPEVLRDYAEEYNADLDMWSFLTGYDFEDIREISIKSFKSMLQPPMPDDDQVGHGTRFFLVNPEGEVVKNYSGTTQDEMDAILVDLKAVN